MAIFFATATGTRLSLALLMLVVSMFLTMMFRPFIDAVNDSPDLPAAQVRLKVSAGPLLVSVLKRCRRVCKCCCRPGGGDAEKAAPMMSTSAPHPDDAASRSARVSSGAMASSISPATAATPTPAPMPTRRLMCGGWWVRCCRSRSHEAQRLTTGPQVLSLASRGSRMVTPARATAHSCDGETSVVGMVPTPPALASGVFTRTAPSSPSLIVMDSKPTLGHVFADRATDSSSKVFVEARMEGGDTQMPLEQDREATEAERACGATESGVPHHSTLREQQEKAKRSLVRSIGSVATQAQVQRWQQALDRSAASHRADKTVAWLEDHVLSSGFVTTMAMMPLRFRPLLIEGLSLLVCSFNLIVGVAATTSIASADSGTPLATTFATAPASAPVSAASEATIEADGNVLLTIDILYAMQFLFNAAFVVLVIATIITDLAQERKLIRVSWEGSPTERAKRRTMQLFSIFTRAGCAVSVLVDKLADHEVRDAMNAAFADSLVLAHAIHETTARKQA